jgi:hypothetical protein
MAIEAVSRTPRRARGAGAWLLLGVILLSPAAARASPVYFGNIVVNPEPEPKGTSSHGYTEYGVAVTNNSSDRSHRVTLSLPRTSFGLREDHIRELSRTLDVGPGATVRFALLQPASPALMGQGITVTIDGRTQDDPVPFNFSRGGSSYGGRYGPGGMGSGVSQPLVLVSPGVGEEFLKQAQAHFGGGPGFGGGAPRMLPGAAVPFGGPPGAMPGPPGGMPGVPELRPPGAEPDEPGAGAIPPGFGGGMAGGPGMMGPGGGIWHPIQFVRADAPPSLWSPNWLGYSRYDGVVLTGAELRTLPATIQTALWQYAEAGGVLLILGAGGKLPDGWRRRQGETPGLTDCAAGFGVCAAIADTSYHKWPRDHWKNLADEWALTATPFGHVRSVADANQLFPVVDDIGIPVRGLFMLMIVFALTIGPANLLLLGRLKRRIWLLWTVPALSLLTCAAVFGYMMVSEGWQGHLRTEAVTILDETSRRASTIGFTGYYAPLTPGDGLRFSPETELSRQSQDDPMYGYRRGGGGSPCTLDWSGDQHLARGWVKPRVPAYFMARKSEARRERVTFGRARDGSLTAVNGLGVDVQKLWYADEQGQVYGAGPVTAGAQVNLRPTGDRLERTTAKTSARVVYGSDWIRGCSPVVANPKDYLSPRSYLAQVEDSPFLEDGLRDAKTRRCRSIVLGFPREGDE